MDTKTALDKLSECHSILASKIVKEHKNWEPEEPPITVLMGGLGALFLREFNSFSAKECEKLFNTVEGLLLNGDDKVKGAVATGFLEAITHRLDKHENAIDVVLFFGQEARSYCLEWDKFTGVKTPGLY